MGASLIAAVAVVDVTAFLILQSFSGSLLPTLTEINSAYDDMEDRAVDRCQTDLIISNATDDGWWNVNWAYRKMIIIDHDKVQAGETAFTVLISRDADTDLANDALNNSYYLVLGQTLTGTLDELRISDTARNYSWINTSNNMMNSPNDFIKVESEQNQQYTYLNVTFENPGSVNLDIVDFTVLVNGTEKSFVEVQPYLYPSKETNIFLGVYADGSKRIKFITGNGISDCEGYG